MSQLIFLHNELLNPKLQKELHIPLEFIIFGITEGRMYRHYNSQNNFIIPANTLQKWGNDVIYGGLFICKDFNFYSRLLDAYHVNSKSTMSHNHIKDLHHRIEASVTVIHFSTLDELAHLKYKEGETITAQTYHGNINHPKIKQRLNKKTSYRVISGIDKENFKQLFWEVNK